MKVVIACGALLMLTGCASIISGTSQEIVVNTNPPGANCALNREGTTIARVNPTPGGTTVKKTKHDLTISCEKDGYQTATYIDNSGVQTATLGNMVLGGLVGWGIDSASGADNHYDSPVNISMVPEPQPAPVSAPARIIPVPQSPAVAPSTPESKPTDAPKPAGGYIGS